MVKLALKLSLLFGLVLLTACSAQPTPQVAPTQDTNVLRTEVAATVLAQVPQILSQTLSALPPTQTPQPTATQAPSPTVAQSETPTQAAGANASVATASGATASGVTATATVETNDLAKWIAQTVADNTHFAPGTSFTMVWRLQNVGTSTWTTGYRLRFFGGNALGAPNEITLDKEVKPNETIDFTLQMKAPTVPGEYNSTWVMSNEVRRNFKESVFLKIIVDAPTATPTKTATVKPTATATPTK